MEAERKQSTDLIQDRETKGLMMPGILSHVDRVQEMVRADSMYGHVSRGTQMFLEAVAKKSGRV